MSAVVKVKNVTGEDRWCPWAGAGGFGAVIKDGEVGIVPAGVYASLDWSHGMFETVDPPKAKS